MSTKRKMPCWNCLRKVSMIIAYLVIFIAQIVDIHVVRADHSLQMHTERQFPTVMVVILVRNKAHTLPWYFGQLEKLEYPKNRISLWIRSDHNADNSTSVIKEWLSQTSSEYHSVDFMADDEYTTKSWNVYMEDEPPQDKGYPDAKGTCHWSDQRITNVLKLRQEGLETARKIWTDYVLYTDIDNFLMNPKTLQILIDQKKTLVGPMLNSSTAYSNFWGGMSERGYYVRTHEYLDLINWRKFGCYQVPMVHSTFLIDLHSQDSLKLGFFPPPPNYDGPFDDIIIFALITKYAGVPMYIINTEFFGFIITPTAEQDSLQIDNERFNFIKLESWIVGQGPPLEASPHCTLMDPPKDKMDFDQIYMINLRRRPDRRKRMIDSMRELGIDAKIFDAIDGKQLNESYLQKLGVKQLPEFYDPYNVRDMTLGEIGCFLSHYFIWEDIVKNGYKEVLLFEDDVRFESYFRRKLYRMMDQANDSGIHWHLIYLGRKRLMDSEHEPWVENTHHLVHVSYTYWTLSYVLTLEGAKKLLDQKPLGKILPVDEYLPIMFGKHPKKEYNKHFEHRDIVAFASEPMLVFPTHYTGETHHYSDTEDSSVISVDIIGPRLPTENERNTMKEKRTPSILTLQSDHKHDEL